MPVKKGAQIAPAKGKLGVLLVGLGAVSTTFIAGVEAMCDDAFDLHGISGTTDASARSVPAGAPTPP